ncbi:transposase [Sinorhizobium fredii]|uniref:transposase n=1 Tax=Rhizobium fredii TaxID=380 RepID=UPI00353093E8
MEAIATALPKVRDALVHEFAGFERKLRAIARQDDNARRLMTTPGVGVLVALTFVAAVDAPERFRSSRAVGPHFGLTPKKYQSGETDHSGRISKIGDGSMRTALYEAANVILTRPVKGSDLKGWALAVARRAGPRKARVALARKLAVVLHCMLTCSCRVRTAALNGELRDRLRAPFRQPELNVRPLFKPQLPLLRVA